MILIGLVWTSFTFGQIVIEGTVKDKENKEGLPFAHVAVEGTANAVVADIDGVFSIAISKEEISGNLVISFIGYDNFVMPIADVQKKKLKNFFLVQGTVNLSEVVVRPPEKILQDAFSKVKQNYWCEKFMIEGFYRKAAIEEDKFTFLTEAVIRLYDKGYHKKEESALKIEITQLRNSEDHRYIETLQGKNPLVIGLHNQDNIRTKRVLKAFGKQNIGKVSM